MSTNFLDAEQVSGHESNSLGFAPVGSFVMCLTRAELTGGAGGTGEWCLLAGKSGRVLTLSMDEQSVFGAAGFVPSWKFMTLLLWHSFIAVVRFQERQSPF